MITKFLLGSHRPGMGRTLRGSDWLAFAALGFLSGALFWTESFQSGLLFSVVSVLIISAYVTAMIRRHGGVW